MPRHSSWSDLPILVFFSRLQAPEAHGLVQAPSLSEGHLVSPFTPKLSQSFAGLAGRGTVWHLASLCHLHPEVLN